MRVFETINEYRYWRASVAADPNCQPCIGFVPTMGALHAGHRTLIEQARRECRQVVVSIFVNPLQFGPNEDFNRYPRQLPADLRLCEDAGADVVFHPSVAEFYGANPGRTTRVVPPADLTEQLCGAFRPGHFEGVATVVLKLFGVVQPTFAYFGEKDYQQLAVIRRMVADLNFPTEIVPVKTVRQADGVALSSRNALIAEEHRQVMPALHDAISFVLDKSLSGELALGQALASAEEKLKSVQDLQLQYLEARHAETLAPLAAAKRPMVVLVAAKLGSVRLIDNVIAL